MTQESPPSSHSQYRAGNVLVGKYLLGRLLGQGGMGSVWLAHNLDLAAPVALKLLRTDITVEDGADRLKREAQAMARLEHPAIVRVFDCGKTELGHPFMVMELVDGETLAELLKNQGPLGSQVAVQMLLPIIDALSLAHEKGVVHRDIKPDNILLSHDSRRTQPKLVDFGIAKLETPLDRITQVDEVIGSPTYMSPEQALGFPDVDARADVWALAMVLYEAVSGAAPFRSQNFVLARQRVIAADIAPLLDVEGRESSLWLILSRALEKDRDHRTASARALGDALAGWLVAQGVDHDICGDAIESNWDIARDHTLATSSQAGARSTARLVTLSAVRSEAPSSTAPVAWAPVGEPHVDSEPTLVSHRTAEASPPPASDAPDTLDPRSAADDDVPAARLFSLPPVRRRSRLLAPLALAAAVLFFAAMSGRSASAIQAAFGFGSAPVQTPPAALERVQAAKDAVAAEVEAAGCPVLDAHPGTPPLAPHDGSRKHACEPRIPLTEGGSVHASTAN